MSLTNLAASKSDAPQIEHVKELAEAKSFLRNEILGQEDLIDFALSCLLAGGHLLLEGPPGTGKTSLAYALSRCFGGQFRRVQMTSDLLPSDVVGILRPSLDGRDFELRKGPIFTHFLLADELNRTSPKTQAALLEAMAENTVSVDGISYDLPKPFFVVATQNPFEFQGVYPLPESQLDRFMMQLVVGHPEAKDERDIYLREIAYRAPRKNTSGLSMQSLERLRDSSGRIFVEESIFHYVQKIVLATRAHAKIPYGVSVRGALQFLKAAQSLALVRGRDFVLPQDVVDLAPAVIGHRLCFGEARVSLLERSQIVQEIVDSASPPK